MRATGGDGVRLFERERELEVFERALDRQAEGVGSLLVVEGPAGIGKTRLLAEAVDLAKGRELLIRAARAGQLEREMPFGVARQLLESVIERASMVERSRLLGGSAGLAELALRPDDPESSGGPGDPFAPIHGLYWLLSNLAESRPVVVVIDDAHWADPQTLRWLEYLARRLLDVPVLILAAVRSGEPDEPSELEALRAEAEILHPQPLSRRAVDQLIASELGSEPTPEFSDACSKITAGNPFLLAEVLRTLRADAIDPGADAANAIEALGPESVARYVLMRLGRFGPDAVLFARATAVLGAAPQLRHAATLSGLEETDARRICDQLREAEILAPGLPIEFVHPLVRSAIYNDQPEAERSAAHHEAARRLRGAGASAAEIVPHLMACVPNGDQWVVGQLGEAAWEAIRTGAYGSAKAYLERALQEPPEDELPLLWGLGKIMIQDDLERAPGVLRDVAERTSDQKMRLSALRDTGLAYFVGGKWHEAARWYAAALETLPEDEREQRLTLESQVCCIQSGSGGRDPTSARRITALAAGAEGRTRGECLVRQALSFERFLDCAPVDDVVALAASFPPPPRDTRMVAPVFGAKVLAWSGRGDIARDAMAQLTESAREIGMLISVSYASCVLAEIDRLGGRLADAEAEARTAWEIAGELAPASNFALAAIANLLAAQIAAGELDQAARLTDGIDLSAGLRDVAVTPWPVEVRGTLRLALGELDAGVEDLMALGEEAESAAFLNPALPPWRQEVAPALAALDRTAEGEELIAVAEQRARAFGAPHVIGIVLRSRALLEPRTRQIETLRESVAVLERYGPPHELARSLFELGAALRRDGQRTESREPLRRALELAHRSGAGGIEARARDELAAAGSRPRSVFRTGVASLTASELRTAKLAADGLSNSEIAQNLFVSKKTVEKHLGNAYMKLEIGGREELAAALKDPADV